MLLLAAACQTTAETDSSGTSLPTSTSTTPVATTADQTPTASTPTSTTGATSTTLLTPHPSATVLIPEGEGPFPAVVLVHGGGWVIGETALMQPLANLLTENGYLTVNTTYQLSLQAPGFPTAIENVACAVRFAAAHPLSDGTVTIIGHSAGAHIGAVVALTGSDYIGQCPIPGSGVPDRFVGLAGPYDVNRLGPIMIPFFGSRQTERPDDWDAGNPMLHTGDNPELRSLLLHGDVDQVVPSDFSKNFYEALLDAGGESEFVILDGADHPGAQNPAIVGALILDWLES